MAMFDIVVATSTAPRDGRFIEKIGTYNPNTIPASIVLDNAKALKWLMNGAQPTDTTRAILSYRGVMYAKHLQVGVLKGALTQEEADRKVAEWIAAKDSKISGRVDSLAKAKADSNRAKLEAESKVNEARAAAIAARQAAELAAEAPEAAAETAPEEAVAETVAEAPAAEAVAGVAAEPAAEETTETAAEEAPEVAVAEPVAEASAEPATEEEKPTAE